MNGQKKKEIILISAMILVSLVLIVVMRLSDGGTKVRVTVGGKEYGIYNLSKDTEIEIISDGGINVLRIENGQASVISASCPDKICVNMYPLSDEVPGIIVCLPNEVIVELVDE